MRINHSKETLVAIKDNWPHTHATNSKGEIICITCMAELLIDIHDMIFKDAARTSDGKVVFT